MTGYEFGGVLLVPVAFTDQTTSKRRPAVVVSPDPVKTPCIVEHILVARARQQADDESPGKRMARFRREKGLTQEELADLLDVTQPGVSDYERGRLIRLQGELIVQLTDVLDVSADDLLGLQAPRVRNGTIKNWRLLRQAQSLEKLPKRDQQAVIRPIEAFLAKAG